MESVELYHKYDGYWTAIEDMLRYVNELDTEGMSAKDVRTAIYTWGLLVKPYGKFKTEG